MADLFGASETDIRRGGRWDMSSMTQHYLTTLPRETIRVLAGFPSSPGQFWLERDLDPPEELERLIFPQAALWYVERVEQEGVWSALTSVHLL